MYRFEAMNGCSRCNAMEGLYKELPARPHPYCRCVISVVDDEETEYTSPASGKPGDVNRKGDRWGWSWSDPDHVIRVSDEDGDGWGETFRYKGSLAVECCDKKTVIREDYELTVRMRRPKPGEDSTEVMEEALMAAEEEVNDRATKVREGNCDNCDLVS
jgi:hypothetical protein